MFSSVGHMSLPSARNSRGPPKVPQGFSVRIFNAPKLSSYPYTAPAKVDLGYRSMANSEPRQKQNWYSRPDTKRNSTSIPRDMPPRSSHFLDINTTTDRSSYESNRPALLSNYSIYPSASKDTYIYQQSVCSKSDNYTDSEATSETFTPSSDISTALTNDSTITLQSTVTNETSTGTSSPPSSVRRPFPIQIPALEQAQAAVSHAASSNSGPLSKLSTAAVYSISNNEMPAAAGRASAVNQSSSTARGDQPSAGGLDMSSVPLSWAIPIRREPPPTRVRRDSNARDSSAFALGNHQAPSHYPTGRESDDRKDSGATYVPIPSHTRVVDGHTSPTHEEQNGRDTYYHAASRGLEREASQQARRDSDNREPSAFDVTSRLGANNIERSVSSFYTTRRDPDIRQESRTVESCAFLDSHSPEYVALPARGESISVGGDNFSSSPPEAPAEEQARPQSHYRSRRDSNDRQESHLRNLNVFPESRTSHGYFPTHSFDESIEAGNDHFFQSTSRGPAEREERPQSARRDSDDRRKNSRGIWPSDEYFPSSGSGAVESLPIRDRHAATSLNEGFSQPYVPLRRDSDEPRNSHTPASSTFLDARPSVPVSTRGEPVYAGARDTYSTSAPRASGERQDSPRSYISTGRNSDERQEFRTGLPSSTSPDTRPSDGYIPSTGPRETNTGGGRPAERQESPASHHLPRRDSDERRQARGVGPSSVETRPHNGYIPLPTPEEWPIAGMRDVPSTSTARVFVDQRESPTSYYPTRINDNRTIPDGYDPVSAPGEMNIAGRRENFVPEVGALSERRESLQSGQPRGISPRGHSGSQDSSTLGSQPSVNTELRPADPPHARRNSDDRLDSPSRAVPLSSSPVDYYSSHGQDTRPPSGQAAPPKSASPSRETPGSRPVSRSSPPQPQRRSSDEVPPGDITDTQGVLSIRRTVRWNDNLICPSPILASQRRKGWYNCRGDQLWTNEGSYKPPPAGQEYPQDLATYPEYGQGWMNEAGVRIDMQHRLVPKPLPRSALKRPQQIFELDVGRNVFTTEG